MSDKSRESDLQFTTIPPDLHGLFYNLHKEVDFLNKKLQAAEEENRILREAVEHCVDDIIAISPDSERNTVCLSLVEDILEQALEKVGGGE